MLYESTVDPSTLLVLKRIMAIEELKSFYLVGGTSLSLRYGHRKSVDLDLFSIEPFDNIELWEILKKHNIPFVPNNTINPIGLFGYSDELKIDFVKHHYFKQIGPFVEEDGIRMFGDKDIIAMKVFTILKRGQKKDFWDIAELLQKYSVDDFVKFYTKKYPDFQTLISIPHAMTYFTDADESEDPVSLKGQTWAKVKKFIQKAVRSYLT